LMDIDPDQDGVLVQTIIPDGPAEEAGLLGSSEDGKIDGYQVTYGGDVIIKADDDEIHDFEDLVTFLARRTIVGQTITLMIIRDGNIESTNLTLRPRPNDQQTEVEEPTLDPEEISENAWLGIAGTGMTEDIADTMDLPKETIGVLVLTVVSNSPADDSGIRGSYKPAQVNGQEMMIGGDIIIRVDGESISSMQTLIDIVSSHESGDQITLSVLRNDRTERIRVTLGEQP